MLAIQTSFVARTEKKPSKIVAKSGISKVAVYWNSDLSIMENHAAAARKLCEALGWKGSYIGGEFAECFYWTPAKSDLAFSMEPPAQEPVEAPTDVPAIPHAADPQSEPVEAPAALPEPIAEPTKPTRQRRAA